MDIIQTPRCVTSFESALGTAFGLAEDYSHAHFAFLLDGSLQLCDLAIYDRSGDACIDALHYAVTKAKVSADISYALVVSLIDTDPDALYQSDIELFLWGETALRSSDVHLLDWINVHNDLYRSFARTVAPNRAW